MQFVGPKIMHKIVLTELWNKIATENKTTATLFLDIGLPNLWTLLTEFNHFFYNKKSSFKIVLHH